MRRPGPFAERAWRRIEPPSGDPFTPWRVVLERHDGMEHHLGDHTDALPTAHGFQEFWGYLYHLDAMEQVSFPDINKSPTQQGFAPPCKNTPIPGLAEVPGAVDPKTTTCL